MTAPEAFAAHASAPLRRATRSTYLKVLTWAFVSFNAVRVFAYLPTLWAIHLSGDSSQHSLWTWLTWVGANATMAAWLYENNDRAINRAVLVSAANATMCLAVTVVIAMHR
jgi:hypothetical protein